MEIKMKLKAPPMPNEIIVDFPYRGRREDGIQPLPTIPVGQLTEEQAMQYAALMHETFMLHWGNLRKNK